MRIAAVVPCYKVHRHIVGVVAGLLKFVDHIIVVDDCCPEKSGEFVEATFSKNSAVQVVFHGQNQGVGGAVVTGYKVALAGGFDICVKVDGDGQMDANYLPVLIQPILNHEADYTKGNRFYRLNDLQTMPKKRLFGNAVLSFVSKASSGYWNIMDPTNGYTAIHSAALSCIDLEKLARRYFFESDILFRLNIVRAVVADVPMPAIYGDEISNLHIKKVLYDFPLRYAANGAKRIFYNYVLRDMNSASIEGFIGTILLIISASYGGLVWLHAWISHSATPIGTVMVVSLLAILGTQLLLAALSYDVNGVPTLPLQSVPTLNTLSERTAPSSAIGMVKLADQIELN